MVLTMLICLLGAGYCLIPMLLIPTMTDKTREWHEEKRKKVWLSLPLGMHGVAHVIAAGLLTGAVVTYLYPMVWGVISAPDDYVLHEQGMDDRRVAIFALAFIMIAFFHLIPVGLLRYKSTNLTAVDAFVAFGLFLTVEIMVGLEHVGLPFWLNLYPLIYTFLSASPSTGGPSTAARRGRPWPRGSARLSRSLERARERPRPSFMMFLSHTHHRFKIKIAPFNFYSPVADGTIITVRISHASAQEQGRDSDARVQARKAPQRWRQRPSGEEQETSHRHRVVGAEESEQEEKEEVEFLICQESWVL